MGIFKKKNSINLDAQVPKIIVGTKHETSESYQRLKDNVIYYSDNGKNKVFQIESAVSGEGKSTVVINLAVALKRSGKRVIVLDLDFRRPKIHRSFNIVNFNGITEYMLGECSKEELIKKTEYGVDVINRGKTSQNAAIIFTSDKFKKLMDGLKEEYDIILLDCPPVLLVSDYIHISKLADSLIFVVSYGVTKRAQLLESVDLLKRNEMNILGTVITFKNNEKYGIKYGGYYKGVNERYIEQ